jgi:hypothetical protein
VNGVGHLVGDVTATCSSPIPTTIASAFGTGTTGYNGSFRRDPITGQYDCPAVGTPAQLNAPHGLAVDDGTSLYVADTGNGLIRRLNTRSGANRTGRWQDDGGGFQQHRRSVLLGRWPAGNQNCCNQPQTVVVTIHGTYRVTDSGNNGSTTANHGERVRSFGTSLSQ